MTREEAAELLREALEDGVEGLPIREARVARLERVAGALGELTAQTSDDPRMLAALQKHSGILGELVLIIREVLHEAPGDEAVVDAAGQALAAAEALLIQAENWGSA